MRCPTCDRDTPDALLVCRHCGASTRPSLLRRLFQWLRLPSVSVSVGRPRATMNDDRLGIEMPALGVKAISVTMTDLAGAKRYVAPDALGPDVLEQLRRAAAGGGQVYYEHVTQ